MYGNNLFEPILHEDIGEWVLAWLRYGWDAKVSHEAVWCKSCLSLGGTGAVWGTLIGTIKCNGCRKKIPKEVLKKAETFTKMVRTTQDLLGVKREGYR